MSDRKMSQRKNSTSGGRRSAYSYEAKMYDSLHDALAKRALRLDGSVDGGNGVFIGQRHIVDSSNNPLEGSMRLIHCYLIQEVSKKEVLKWVDDKLMWEKSDAE